MGKRHLRQGEHKPPVTVLSGTGGGWLVVHEPGSRGVGSTGPSGVRRRGVQPGGGPATAAGRQRRCLHVSEQGGLPLPPGLGRGGGGTKASILMALLHPSAPFTQPQ